MILIFVFPSHFHVNLTVTSLIGHLTPSGSLSQGRSQLFVKGGPKLKILDLLPTSHSEVAQMN